MNAASIRVMCVVMGLPLASAGWANQPAAAVPAAQAAASRPNMAEHAMRMLQEGNERFCTGKVIHPNTDVFRVNDTGSNGQHPFAAIVTCADSRVAVERLFDRGVGDLFVVRVAGNVCDPNETGSVEYACEHLGTQLVVVMGHSKCGAVKAAVGGVDAGKNVGSLLDNIVPAVQNVKSAHPDLAADDLVDAVVHENVWQGIEDMFKGSSTMREMVERGSVKVVGAVYDVTTGRVEWMGQHPSQMALIKSEGEPAAKSAAVAPTGTNPTTTTPVVAAGKQAEKNDKADKSPAEKTGFVKPAATANGAGSTKKEEPDDHGKPASTQAAHPH